MKTIIFTLLITMVAPAAWAKPWPQTPPKIGRIKLKQEYWDYMKEAAARYKISPYLIQAVCAIESRYDPEAKSGKCFGLMQLHKDTAKKYGVDAHDPRENIMGGAAVLANLMHKYDGDIRRVLGVYNASCTAAYRREVLRAYQQALESHLYSPPQTKPAIGSGSDFRSSGNRVSAIPQKPVNLKYFQTGQRGRCLWVDGREYGLPEGSGPLSLRPQTPWIPLNKREGRLGKAASPFQPTASASAAYHWY